MALNAQITPLETIPIHDLAKRAKALHDDELGAEKMARHFPPYEWQRISFAFEKIQPGQRCLEVGPGRGYLSNMICWSRKFDSQYAIDIRKPQMDHWLDSSITFIHQSITDMDFPDNYFDTVICMEVLEHLEDDDFHQGLAQIRRVCKNHLMMSVPYLEPLPLPKYHKQRLDEARIKSLFPQGRFTLMLKSPNTRVPWLLIEETQQPEQQVAA